MATEGEPMAETNLTNWAGNVVFRAVETGRPTSLAELQSTVARATHVRVLGCRHSFSSIADTTGTHLSLDGMPDRFEIDADAATVTVGASMRYAELGRRLNAEGWAVPNLASLPHISIAGACATATHGSGNTNGNVATAVSGLEMVTAEGDLVTVTRKGDPDVLPGAVVSLGCLGVVVSVTLDLVPAFPIQQYVYQALPFDALLDHFAEIFASAYSVSLFTDWGESRLGQIWLKRRPDPTPPEPGWLGARLSTVAVNPLPTMPADNATEQLGIAGPWHERLPHFRSSHTPSRGDELQSEFFVPRDHAVDALRALDRRRGQIAAQVQISEVRTIAADQLWLSPAYRQDLVAFHFTWVNDLPAVLPVIELVEHELQPYSPRPHWGKLFTMAAATIRSRYPRLGDFKALARQYDPTGKFTNDFVERTLFAG